MLLGKPASFWNNVTKDPGYLPLVERIRTLYEEKKEETWPSLPYSLRHIYYETGSRSEFEAPYFKRRHFLSAAALLCLMYPEEEHYLREVIDVIFAISDEYCWALPAHTGDDFEENASFVDLFASETGFLFAEISTVLGDRLPELVQKRIRKEFHERIVEGLRKRRYFWEIDCTNNWAAVCGGACGMAMMYLEPEAFEEMKPRISAAMEHFLAGYPSDGTCLEGTGYWHYGFGYFCAYADLLCRYTEGREDYFADPKVENIATYMQQVFLLGNTVVSFSDGSRVGLHTADYGLQHYLYKRYPASVKLLPEICSAFTQGNTGWLYEYRSFMFYDPEAQAEVKELARSDRFLPEAGQAFFHRPSYSLVVKAGDNDEPHNHNDVGNFILSTKDGQILVDLGSGLYTREYFRPETRYSYFCNNSGSHNVPIVNGLLQKEGKEYAGTISMNGPDSVELEFSKAYGLPELKSLKRHMDVLPEGILLEDRFEGEIQEFLERFVTLEKPVFETLDGVMDNLEDTGYVPVGQVKSIRFHNVRICLSDTAEAVRFHEETYLCHAPGGSLPVWCLSVRVKPDAGDVKVRFTVED